MHLDVDSALTKYFGHYLANSFENYTFANALYHFEKCIMLIVKINCFLKMDSFEFYIRYESAKERYESAKESAVRQFRAELYALKRAYISSNYGFKVGDVVILKEDCHRSHPFMLIESIRFIIDNHYCIDEYPYRNPIVEINGCEVDEEGYIQAISGFHILVSVRPDEVIGVTKMRAKSPLPSDVFVARKHEIPRPPYNE